MTSSMIQTEYIAAPVTALAFAGGLLLSGEGPCLHLYDVTSTEHLQVQQVLKHANIHGIRTAASADEDCWDVALFGQKTLQLLQIRYTDSAISRKGILVTLNQHGECEVHDWIWDVCWLQSCQTEGKDVRQLALALGHNTVVLWDAETQRSTKEVHCQEKCILYCAHFIGTSWLDLVLAAGTVFREVVLWKPCSQKKDQDCVPFLQRIAGHQGVIFSVCYHPPTGRLCTASDDRSVRLWQVTGPLLQLLDSGKDVDTAVISGGQFELVFEVYGHGSRVWDVKLTHDHVITVGEDAQCIVWSMQGEIIKTFRGHKGNSIWSLAVSEQQGLVATGGGDSSIRLWKLHHSEDTCDSAVTSSTLDLPLPSGDFPRSLVSCLDHLFLVVTDQGSLYSYNTAIYQWSLVLQDPIYSSYSLLEVSAQGMVAMGSLTGKVKVFHIDAPGAHWETTVYDGKVLSLTWVTQSSDTVSSLGDLLSCGPEGEVIWWTTQSRTETAITVQKTATFQLPYSRQRWLTCALLAQNDSTCVCGDRRGSLHCYRKQGAEPTQPFHSLIGIHGKTGVTSLQLYRTHVYSTGRDGHYRQFHLGPTGLQLLKNNRVYKGFEWLENLKFCNDGEVLAMGFHTSSFVVWSLSANEPVLKVECGGGHRAWGILPDTCQGALFAYIKARSIQLSKGPSISSNKRFILKDSLHGREMTCLKFLGWASNNEDVKHAICATASEDTTINIVALRSSGMNRSDLVVLDTIQDHISSVRCLAVCPQHIAPGSSQCASSPKLLFSGGGRAQLKCYRVSVTSRCDVKEGKQNSHTYQSMETNMQHVKNPTNVEGLSADVVPGGNISKTETGELQESTGVNRPSKMLANETELDNDRTLQATWKESIGHNSSILDAGHATSNANSALECHIEYLASHNLVERKRRKKSGVVQLEEEEEVEMRYMALTAWHGGQVGPGAEHLFFVAAACSDGFLRLFMYDDEERKLQLFCVSDFHHHCVLSVDHFFISTADGATHSYVLSGATDGQIAVWNLKPILSSSIPSLYHSTHGDITTDQETLYSLPLEASATVSPTVTTAPANYQDSMDASTKGMKAANSPPSKVSGHCGKTGALKMKLDSPDIVLKKHQSGVNAFSIQRVDDQHYLLASGGDDNSLQITVLAVQEQTPHKPLIVAMATASQSAHAATITGVHILDNSTVLTTSVDQRVNLWKCQLVLNPSVECHLSFLNGKFCHIADIAGLECWKDESGHQYIAVCGRGMQLLTTTQL